MGGLSSPDCARDGAGREMPIPARINISVIRVTLDKVFSNAPLLKIMFLRFITKRRGRN
jgi:hypothetical protein